MATIETSEVLSTKDAAANVGMKPNELTDFVKKHAVDVPRIGRTYLWTPEVLTSIRHLFDSVQNKCCIHCGRLWDRPDTGKPKAEAGGE